MTWIDAAALVIVILSAAFSMVRGFVREALGVAAWIGAAFAAVKFYSLVQPEMASILPKNLVDYGSMALVFLVVLIVLSLISALIGGYVRDSALSGLDSSLGLVFGAVRGALVVCLAYIALSVGVAPEQWPAPVNNARFLPMAYQGATALVSLLPKQYQPKVDPLPGKPAPSAGSLMQQPVAGSALSAH
ncbi:CvpA family protein [Acidocella sp.]|uniref:CvpA family protein n=1 Tax=Acidocella sp. TaxID=50710 RepID=UPI001853E2D1|nr:CvpA family protein [Acidocella sp.]NNM57167.1 CvpA family protein [Acidocella sp.]